LQAWYLRAHRGASGSANTLDSFDAVLDVVRAELAALQPTRLVTIGASMGAYAAIRAGLALDATAVLAFGPQVFIHPAERDALALPWMFFDGTLSRLEAACAAEGVRMDALTAVEPRGAGAWDGAPVVPTTTVEVHVGEEAHGDVREGAMLREAMMLRGEGAGATADAAKQPRVELIVHARMGHALVKDLRDGGALDALLVKHLAATDSTVVPVGRRIED